MTVPSFDTIAFVQRLVELVDTGRRESTYKLATLTALIDVCVENEAAHNGTLAVPVQELAHRIIAYYWPQVRAYDERIVLSQNKSSGRTIPVLVARYKASTAFTTAEAAREVEDEHYVALVRDVELTVARQPLTHFHTPAGRNNDFANDDFVFDARGFHKKMSRTHLVERGHVVLRSGVPRALRDTSVLLRSFVKNAWVADVVGMNKVSLDVEAIDGFLFGTSREALTTLNGPLRDLQDNRCFYCDSKLGPGAHIDHVLPWSRIPIDGVANLVAADSACNLAKSASVPVRAHVDRALRRPRSDLLAIADRTRVPLLHDRTRSAAEGVYASLPAGVPLWIRSREYEPFVPV
ncbi:HNH endonuclease [Rhodococcus sp. RS1C4]|nr:HNH endonuclease domain-containing protein [Rhodococcus sp. RS1C4]OZC49105.1 HNH endonuclease [Rhodococcus sp. RS1C4]